MCGSVRPPVRLGVEQTAFPAICSTWPGRDAGGFPRLGSPGIVIGRRHRVCEESGLVAGPTTQHPEWGGACRGWFALGRVETRI